MADKKRIDVRDLDEIEEQQATDRRLDADGRAGE